MERLLIYDSDPIYAERLMDYIRKRRVKGFDFRVFTDKERLIQYVNNHSLDFLVSSDKEVIETLSLKNKDHIIYLSEEPLSSQEEANSRVYKYQSTANVLSEIISIHTRLCKNPMKSSKGDNNLQVISVFSLISHPLKSQYAWSLAEKLSNNRNVLFIPMELLPTKNQCKIQLSNQGISEIIYYLKEDSPDLLSVINSSISYQDRISYISGLSHGFDLISLDKDDAKNLLDMLKSDASYDVIIFYLGLYTEFSQEIISSSDSCYVTLGDEEYEEDVFKEWIRQTEFVGDSIDMEKLKKIEV